MAVKPSVVGVGSLDQAAGDNPALRAMLQQLATAANTQATKTNTSGKTPPGQSTAAVSFQNPFYVVTIVDPGGQTTLSLNQAAQQAADSSISANSTLSNIFHQVQSATSVLFDAPANLKTYGGDQGNLQNQFVIGDLDTKKNWYFRFRTSYDGQTWNQWKVINPKATSVNPNAVTLEPVAGGQWAGVTLPGGQAVGFGIGQLASGLSIQTADGVLLANTIGVCGPATYADAGQPAKAIADQIDSLGVISLLYSNSGLTWPGKANFLTFGFASNGAQNLSEVVLGDGGRWVVMTLSGGSRIAIGVGHCTNGTTIDVPAGFTVANSMGVSTPLSGDEAGGWIHGIDHNNVTAGLVTCQYNSQGGINVGVTTANWFVIAWEAALSGNLVTVAGGQYLRLPSPSGAVMIGVTATHSGAIMPIPPGYTYPKCLAFSVPSTTDNPGPGIYMHGMLEVEVDAGGLASLGTVTCLYSDDAGNTWGGDAATFAICWL